MTNEGTTLIQSYDIQAEVLHKINELKAQGFKEEDMYVIAKYDDQLSMVQGQTNVHLDAQEDDDIMSRFKAFITGEDSTRHAFTQMGLGSSEADDYYRQVENGKLVLYVNSDYSTTYKPQTNTSTTARMTTAEEVHLRSQPESFDQERNIQDTEAINTNHHRDESDITNMVEAKKNQHHLY
ncbi:hypothetical protein GPDM_03390 [Planococcus donghaensis MPA1U2]|uniref:General stress protein 17M-like domain-containing protein n=1 Tax=Planococcus donghaensis MPA1U2 TaxID=933115 RepID=E7RDZ6_9BACL|nr:general stress protein [Planococcus donghaensis]EGA90810.1 hypothetical protein GPDM_03390 [Planococcus donghaensis MPA1U2]